MRNPPTPPNPQHSSDLSSYPRRIQSPRDASSPRITPASRSGRLIVMESIHYYGPDPASYGIPVSSMVRHAYSVDSKEQPYVRTIEVSKDWQPLDLGWLKDKPIALVILKNNFTIRQKNPTEEEAKEDNDRVLLVSVDGQKGHFMIHPNDSWRGVPCCPLFIKCKSGTTSVSITVIPK